MNKVLRAVIFIIAAIFLIWFILPVSIRVINPGNILGSVICVYLLVWSGFNKWYKKLKKRLCASKTVRIIWKGFNIIAAVFASYAVIISGLMIFTAFASVPAENSTAVVLGAQVKPWGPSTHLQQRINASIEYLRDNTEAKAVVTGGKGQDEPISEAQSMYNNITNNNIDGRRIYKEDKAVNTKENIKFSYRIINDNKLNKNMAIVTDSYHQLRTRIIIWKLGINSRAGSVNTTNNKIGLLTYPTFFVREWIAIPFELIR